MFVGRDVAKALGYSNTSDALRKHVDDEDKGVAKCDTLGGTQKTTLINESGLYALILSSKLEQARAFKHWVRILSYLRDNTTTLQLLANKRTFILSLMREKIAAAFPEADPNDIEVELALKLMDN